MINQSFYKYGRYAILIFFFDIKNICKGGPSYYIKYGLNNKFLGTAYAIIILLIDIIGFISIQTNTITHSIQEIITIEGYLDIGIIDTMEDLIVNFIGAFTYSVFGYLYILNKEKNNIASKFLIKKKVV